MSERSSNAGFFLFDQARLNSELQRYHEEFRRTGREFGVILFQVDHLERIRKRWGREVAEKVRAMAGQAAANGCRPYDVFGYWDEETFLGIVTVMQVDDLGNIAERIRSYVEQSSFMLSGKKQLSVTVSIGVGKALENDSVEMVLDRARRALDFSQDIGDNQVTIAFQK
jgi:diguanylate cyclase (GGDEF)-like protein